MINTSNKIFITIVVLTLIAYIYLIVARSHSNNVSAELNNVGHTLYLLEPRDQNPYFANDIYIVPGQAQLSHNINTKEYDNSYLPYENASHAIH